jgi:catechol 2,3-dioxygenase-like lactoylglutathione lyase family enzyme
MEIEGIDRLVITVKDMDRALDFFSKLFGIEFEEVTDPRPRKAANVKLSVGRVPQKCNFNIELLQALEPVKDMRPPDTKAIAKSVEDVDASLFAITVRVKDTAESATDLKREGVRIYHKIEIERGSFFGITNFKELFTEEADTLGIRMAFVEYQEPKKE